MTSGAHPTSIEAIISKGDVADGVRSRRRAKALLPDLKRALDLSPADNSLDKAMLDFIIEVVLGAAWYQRRYLAAHWEIRRYIALNVVAIVGFPFVLLGLLWIGQHWMHETVPGMLVSQMTGILTGVLALQKTLSSWYASQQRFAAWYKSAADLKTLYYSFVQNWQGNVSRDQAGCRRALAISASSARQIIAAEQLDYFQKLALPSFDVLDMLTGARSSVSALVGSLLPGAAPATIVAAGKSSVAATPVAAAPSSIPGPSTLAIVPGGPVPRSSVYRVAPGVTLAFNGGGSGSGPDLTPGASGNSNWITYASCSTDGTSIASFKATWTVPQAPSISQNQTIFLFNGAQTADGKTILQPVLQWGDSYLNGESPNDTGQFWTIASWAVVNGVCQTTDHQRVAAGQMLTGVITLEQQTESGYLYSCEFEGIPGTRIPLSLAVPLVNCVEVLEAYEQSIGEATRGYDLFDRQEYPNTGSIGFTGIDIAVASGGKVGVWSGTSCVKDFGESTMIVTNAPVNGAVDIVIPLQSN